MSEAVIVAYGRSAVGRAVKGSLAQVNPIDYGAEVLRGVLAKVPQLDPIEIDDVVVGVALPEASLGLNAGRNVVLRAGLPHEVSGVTVDRFCASGLQAIADATARIQSNMADVIVAGGIEHMSSPVPSDTAEFHSPWLEENTDAYLSVGLTAENVAVKYGISRQKMDEFAVRSHSLAAKAVEAGRFDDQIIPVTGKNAEGEEFSFTKDETIRPTTSVESLTGLRPAFKEDGVITAGTSSPRSDGAAFVVIVSKEKADELGLAPVAKLIGFAVGGVDPAFMGMGPVAATPKVLKRTGIALEDIDVIELNEAFASQSIASIEELGLDLDKVNPNGGALALGHPLGATGANLTCKALAELQRTSCRYALVTMCIGGGMGAAGVLELL